MLLIMAVETMAAEWAIRSQWILEGPVCPQSWRVINNNNDDPVTDLYGVLILTQMPY